MWDLVELIGDRLREYEARARPWGEAEPVEALRYLMQAHGPTQCDLPEVGNQGCRKDIAVDTQGCPVFVNTRFSCLATVSERHSFIPLWQAPFITKLAAEDRCHRNGVALDRGVPRYATAVGRSDVADGWREHRAGGGLLIDVERNAVVLDGLSMPHSPRFLPRQALAARFGPRAVRVCRP